MRLEHFLNCPIEIPLSRFTKITGRIVEVDEATNTIAIEYTDIHFNGRRRTVDLTPLDRPYVVNSVENMIQGLSGLRESVQGIVQGMLER